MDKSALLETIIATLATELDTLAQAARDARQYATDEESRAEDKHDTRAIEASYLADGQERAALELSEAITAYRALAARAFRPDEPVALSALIELELGRQRDFYFVGPSRGGSLVKFDGREVFVITPQSPLGRKLLGRRAGDTIDLDGPRGKQTGRIVRVE